MLAGRAGRHLGQELTLLADVEKGEVHLRAGRLPDEVVVGTRGRNQ